MDKVNEKVIAAALVPVVLGIVAAVFPSIDVVEGGPVAEIVTGLMVAVITFAAGYVKRGVGGEPA